MVSLWKAMPWTSRKVHVGANGLTEIVYARSLLEARAGVHIPWVRTK